jgi:hypothetical protein
MDIKTLLAAIDDEIKRLEQARKILTGAAASGPKATPASKAISTRPRRKLSTEGRARIAEAQRKRWAAKKVAKA